MKLVAVGNKTDYCGDLRVERPMSHMRKVRPFETSPKLDMTVGGAWNLYNVSLGPDWNKSFLTPRARDPTALDLEKRERLISHQRGML